MLMTNSCRRPPLPFYASPKGTCRWCGKSVAFPLRNWHPECASAYNLAVNSGTQRAIVYARDKGVCKKCGVPVKMWQADHIVPLHSIPPSQIDDYPGVLRFWCADNLQTLCYPHHNEKTAQEATQRAKVKRIKARIDGTRRQRPKVAQRQPWKPNTRYIDRSEIDTPPVAAKNPLVGCATD